MRIALEFGLVEVLVTLPPCTFKLEGVTPITLAKSIVASLASEFWLVTLELPDTVINPVPVLYMAIPDIASASPKPFKVTLALEVCIALPDTVETLPPEIVTLAKLSVTFIDIPEVEVTKPVLDTFTEPKPNLCTAVPEVVLTSPPDTFIEPVEVEEVCIAIPRVEDIMPPVTVKGFEPVRDTVSAVVKLDELVMLAEENTST